MLAFIRRRKWIWIVVIAGCSAAMVITLIPFVDLGLVSHYTGDVAQVGTETVSAEEFSNAFHGYMDQIGTELSPEMLQAFGFDTQVINSLIDQYVMIAEAKRLGLNVSPREVQQAILSIPELQENGVFIGIERYQTLLAQNGLAVAEFEKSISDQVLLQKAYTFLTAPISVQPSEVETEYRYMTEQARLDFFVVDGPAMQSQVVMTEEEQRAYYEENIARYTLPEKRRAQYVFVDTIRLQGEIEVPDEELQAYYDERIADYRIEPRVSAQHILFRTQEKTPEEVAQVRELATDLVERAKAGEDFGELAREYSEDTSAQFGGDLGSFGPGQMVPAFEAAAFALGAGATSDLVETEFGIHIIRVNEKEEARTRTLDEVRAEIEAVVRAEVAREMAANLAQSVAVDLVSNRDPEAVAQNRGAEFRETELMARGDIYNGLADTAALENQIFSLEVDEVGTAVPVLNGYVIPIVTEIQESRQATFEEALDRVPGDLRIQKAQELAGEATIAVSAVLENGGSLAEAAEAAGLQVLTSDLITRDGTIPEFGSTAELDGLIFSMDLLEPASPVTVAGRTIAFQVAERTAVDPAAMAETLPDLSAQLLERKKAQFFSAYGTDVRTRMERDGDISINTAGLAQVAEEALVGHVH